MLLFRPFQRKFDQVIDQGGHGSALVLHELGVHADGGEAGEGIDLVDHHPVGTVLHKEVAAGQTLAVQGGVSMAA